MKGPTVGIIAALFANAGCERGAQVATLQLAVDSLRAAIDSSDTRISSIEYDQILGSGWTYQRARLYDPQTGRFSQTDPIGIAGGMNGYGFAGRDPINFSDPFGLCPPADNITGPHCNVIVKGLFPNVSTGANRIGCTAARLGKTVASWREVARSEIDVIGAVFDFHGRGRVG